MKNILFFFGLLILSISFFACDTDNENCLRPFGDKITKEYVYAEEIRGLEIEVPANLYITQDKPQKIMAEGHENILDKLRFHLNGDVLDVEWNVDCVHSTAGLNFDVTLDKIEEITIVSSGNVYGQNHFDLDDIELNIVGSGNMDLGLDADEIDAQITGSGRLDLEGTANEFSSTITGSGNVQAYDLTAEKAYVTIAGSGNVYLNVTDEMVVTISGSGNVHYRGNPTITVNITGTGKLISEN